MVGMPGTRIDTPAWVQDAVFYQIFPDRFARSERVPKPAHLEEWQDPPTTNGYKGGDLLGVVEHLDHVAELGATALYLNPVFQSTANHRYHTHDYFRVDPLLGGDGALRELLDRAHERGIRVVLDGVFNHASRGMLQFNDILENGAKSPYLDWFHVRRFPLHPYGGGDIGYDAWWNLPALPKFNTTTTAVREFLWGVGEHWLRQGIDGWRLDVPNEIDDDAFWREFRRRCRAVSPDCYLVGEIWDEADRWLAGDQFDAVMNYPLARALFGFVGSSFADAEIARSGYRRFTAMDAPAFAAELTGLLRRYPNEVVHSQLNLLGSHDTPRALTMLDDDEAALRLAYLLLFTLPGAPCIYYGDEIGLRGGHDPACRQAMPWRSPESWNAGLLGHLRMLASLRREHPALRRGATRVLASRGRVVVFVRQDERERLVVAVNAGTRAAAMPSDAALRGPYRDLIDGTDVHLGHGDAVLPARSGRLLQGRA